MFQLLRVPKPCTIEAFAHCRTQRCAPSNPQARGASRSFCWTYAHHPAPETAGAGVGGGGAWSSTGAAWRADAVHRSTPRACK